MKTIISLAALSLALAVSAAQAQGMSMPKESNAAAKKSVSRLPFVNAVVQKVDASAGTVVLKHEDIPNLGMSGMTMQFDVAEKKMLKRLKAGEKVRFQVDMIESKAVVTKLERSK